MKFYLRHTEPKYSTTAPAHLPEFEAAAEPNPGWLGCCPNTGGWLLPDTVPKAVGTGWEPAENSAAEDGMDPKPEGLGWLAPWLCPNVGVWLAPNAGLEDSTEVPVPNTKEDPGGPSKHLNHNHRRKTIPKNVTQKQVSSFFPDSCLAEQIPPRQVLNDKEYYSIIIQYNYIEST